MTDPFSAPAAGGSFNAADHLGKLLLITPKEYKTGIKTTFGEKDVVVSDIVVIDEANPTGSEEIDDGFIFGGVMIGQTKPLIGKGLVLGRLGQKPTDKGNPAWVLSDPTEAEKEKARAYLASVAPSI